MLRRIFFNKRFIASLSLLLLLAAGILYYLMFLRVTNAGLTFTNLLYIPPILEPTEEDGQKIFELVVQHGEAKLLAGQPSETMGYNGSYLGPTIRVERGDQVVINVENQLNEATATHWHGLHVPAEMDGTPHQLSQPGETWQARYPILNQAATMWYHPHPHGHSATQVYQGLAGFYIIDDANSQRLDLPKTYGVDDIPLAIQDRTFDDDGALVYAISNGASYGNEILVNGTHNPFLKVPAKQIRLRLLNGSNARIYHFGFDDGRPFYQIATDGGFLETPVRLTRLRLASGERAEIVVDLSDGNEAILKSYPTDRFLYLAESVAINFIGNSQFDILKLVPEPTDGATVDQPLLLPPILNQIDGWSEEDADNVRTIRMAGGFAPGQQAQQGGGGGRQIPINGKLMDMARIDEVITLDDTEIWEITNGGGVPHPFHIHDIQFLIMDRDGVKPHASEAGWKDTVIVYPGETVRFITQFTTYANPDVPYMYHCHILEHEDRGMMGQFVVVQ
ncbi:MAG: multicopper oxidase domain-containing protein [Chloroflexota bacterium]